MSNRFDDVTRRPQPYSFEPPTIIAATNGFMLRRYDVTTDEFVFTIAPTLDDVEAALNEWAANICESVMRRARQDFAKVAQAA